MPQPSLTAPLILRHLASDYPPSDPSDRTPSYPTTTQKLPPSPSPFAPPVWTPQMPPRHDSRNEPAPASRSVNIGNADTPILPPCYPSTSHRPNFTTPPPPHPSAANSAVQRVYYHAQQSTFCRQFCRVQIVHRGCVKIVASGVSLSLSLLGWGE